MKNSVFSLKSNAEKRLHLGDVLKVFSEGALDDEMIGRILPEVALHKQHTVSVFSCNRRFQKTVAQLQNGQARMTIVSEHVEPGCVPAAALIAPPKQDSANSGTCAILVYVPKPHRRKGAKTWAREKRIRSSSMR